MNLFPKILFKSDFSFSRMNSHAVVITKLQEQPSLELIKCVNILRDKKTTDLLNST